ncbi:MAG: diacylglycerol kinase family lipid kinase [Candidatus Neomarinimicrobiota bacterium]|nr:MAG: diacylglycerol kinase family lipid kinase [Candidatus Neomarinimicrobiota bacterium]
MYPHRTGSEGEQYPTLSPSLRFNLSGQDGNESTNKQTVTESGKKYLLIVNPAASSGKTMKALPQLERLLQDRDVSFEFHFTNEPWHAVELVQTLGQAFDVVVSVGGDGTVNEIINGLPELKKPLGMIPIGTGNDFARSCNIPHDDLAEAVDILLRENVKYLDVGEINGRRFINALGMGFEGRSNDIGIVLSFIKGSARYLLAIAYTFFTYRRIPMKIILDDDLTLETDTFLISVGNGWNVGGGLRLTPQARLDDGYFDVSYIERISRWRILTNFYRLFNGTITELDEIQTFRAKTLSIESPISIPLHLDGEMLPGDRTRLLVTLHPHEQPVIGNWDHDPRDST